MALTQITLSDNEQVYLARMLRRQIRLKQQHLEAISPYPNQTPEQFDKVRDQLRRKIAFLTNLHDTIDSA